MKAYRFPAGNVAPAPLRWPLACRNRTGDGGTFVIDPATPVAPAGSRSRLCSALWGRAPDGRWRLSQPAACGSRGSLVFALIDQRAFLDPGHHRAQLGTPLLDWMGIVVAPGRLEARQSRAKFLHPHGGELARLDVAENALH